MTTLLSATLKFGLAPAICLYLVWALTTGIGQEVRANHDILSSHVEATVRLQQALDRQEYLLQALVDLARQQCVNSAKTSMERNACFLPGGR